LVQAGGSVDRKWGESVVMLHNILAVASQHLSIHNLAPNQECRTKILQALA
jgi:hypothetical protein